jgi:hypothetical protein
LVESGQVGFSIEGFLGLKLSNQINTNMPELEEGKVYTVKDGELIEVTEEVAMAEETTEEVSEEVEVKEEEMATEEDVKSEEAVEVEAAVDPAADAEAILAIVTPLLEEKIAEVLQVIADLKNEMTESEDEAPSEEVEMNLSATQRFTNITKFLKGK